MPQFTEERINFLCHVCLLTSCLCFPSSTPTPPLTLPVTPRRAACPTLFASTCVLSTRHIWGEAPPPCFCQLIHLRVFIPASCVFVIFALAGAANSFPLTPSLFFIVFFRVNTQRIQEIPNIYRGNGRAPWALQEHSGFRFPAEIYRPLTPLDDDETIALTMEQRGENTSWPCHDLDTILTFSTVY